MLLVLAYAVGQGRRIAVPTALGVATGDLIAMSASFAGLGVWLGLRMILGATATSLKVDAARGAVAPSAAFVNAAAVTALNPKSIVFFIAFVPQFIDRHAPLGGQAAILIATFVALAAINALAYALLADRLRSTIRRPAVIAWLTRAGGGALVAMGIATAGMRRATS